MANSNFQVTESLRIWVYTTPGRQPLSHYLFCNFWRQASFPPLQTINCRSSLILSHWHLPWRCKQQHWLHPEYEVFLPIQWQTDQINDLLIQVYLPEPRVTDVNVKWRTRASCLHTSFLRLESHKCELEWLRRRGKVSSRLWTSPTQQMAKT